MIKNRYLKTFLLLLSIFFVWVLPARAFEISPVKSLFTIDPGTSQTIIIKIKNTPPSIPPLKGEGQGLPAGQAGVGFKLNVLGMIQDEEGKPVFSRGVDLAESWVYPENNLVNIKPGETKSINFIIKIPADAVAGSYYLGLAVEPILEKNGSSSLNTRLVSLLTLEVEGLVRESVIIEKWAPSASWQNDLEIKKLKFDLNLKNNGTIEVLMAGSAAIRNWREEEIFSQPIILGNKFLAGSKRVLHPEVIFENKINLPGLYSAQIKINYGRTNQMVSAIVYVWYFPMWSKIVLGIAGLVLVLLAVVVVKRARRK